MSRPRTRERVVVLNDPHAMRINKELAAEIGFQESIVFLQIEFLVSISEYERGGKTWTRQSLKQLRDDHFPWWSQTTISRILHRLEERNLIRIERYNHSPHDHTQWMTIDPEGVEDLASVAFFQNEKSMSPDCKIDVAKMKNVYIEEQTYKEEIEEGVPNGTPKKISRLSSEDAQNSFDELCESDPNGEKLRDLALLLAEENKSGEVAASRVWREIGKRYLDTKLKHELSEEAWAYGFDAALSRGAANIGYVLKAAKGYRTSLTRQRNSIAVVGAKEEDYNLEDYV